MKEGWQKKTLDELCKIARGGSPRPIKAFLTNDPDGVNWIKISDATASTKYIYETKEKIRPEGVKRSRLVHDGDFLLSNSMSFGRPYIMRISGCIHDGWLVLSDKSGQFDQDYLYYFLGSPAAYRQFDDRAAGSTVRNLNIDSVRSVKVPLPSLPEQKRIVAILDEAFEGIAVAVASTEKNLANARELFESYLNAIFTQRGDGWVAKPISEVVVPSGTVDPRKKPDKLFRYVDVSSISNKTFEIIETSEIAGKDAPSRARRIIRSDDILFATVRPTLRRIAVVPKELDGQVCSTGYFVFRTKPELNGKFLFYHLFTDEFMGAMENIQSGASYPAVNDTQVKQQNISFPKDVSEQRQIVNQIDEISSTVKKLKDIYQQKLKALTELKQSILQKAFAGELTAELETATKKEVVA